MEKTKRILLISLIAFITIFSRFVGLDKIPPSLSNDEISIAYDAYSVGQNAKDEYGNYLPISFRSHNTYKAPLTAYLAVIPIKILGTTNLAVKFPSAFLGCLTVLILSLIVFELSHNFYLASTAAAFLALTPWHIYSSRMAMESNVALFFLATGIWLLIKNRLFLGGLFMALSAYGYHTEWGLAPIMLLVTLVFFCKKRSSWISTFIIFCLILSPIVINFVQHPANTRASTQWITGEPGVSSILNNRANGPIKKVLVVVESVWGNYSGYFNFGYLFFDGLDLLPKDNWYQTGLLLFSLLPFFIIGLFKLKSLFPKNYHFIIIWLLVSPLIPSFTKGGLVYVRNLVTVLPLTLVCATGWWWTFKKVNRFWQVFLFGSIIFSAYFSGIIYYIHFPREKAENFQYGYKQAALYFKEHYSEYDKFIIDPRFGEFLTFAGVPHLYIGYYTQLDPTKLQNRVSSKYSWSFDKYEIKDINWNAEVVDKKTLYLVPAGNLPLTKKYDTVKKIELPNHKPGFELIRFN